MNSLAVTKLPSFQWLIDCLRLPTVMRRDPLLPLQMPLYTLTSRFIGCDRVVSPKHNTLIEDVKSSIEIERLKGFVVSNKKLFSQS